MKEVLNHGHVRLVDSMGDDLSIVRSARVSYDAAWRTGEDEGRDIKLIDYLMKHRHTTPFESVVFTFDVKAPIFVFRQWHRHRTQCLTGDTTVAFIRPVDGKAYPIDLRRLEATWNPKEAKRRRTDQSPLSLAEHNRKRLQGMKLRCRGANGEIEETRILDVWKSGTKEVYEVRAGGRKIRASADHKFFSDGEWVPVSGLAGRNVTLLASSGRLQGYMGPAFTEAEIAAEKWVEFEEGYRVSDLGRVQTQWGQGARSKSDVWREKKVTVSPANRPVVSTRSGRALQVSRLVAQAFIPGEGDFVLHKDDNILDNRATNLKWGTAKDNAEDSKRNGTRAVRSWISAPVESIVLAGVEDTFDISVEHSEHCFVANSFLVHNCYNEVSARYSVLPEEYYIPEVSQITTQATDNKQCRTGDIHPDAEHLQDDISLLCKRAFDTYRSLIKRGCPRELARGVLPVNTFSQMFTTVNLHNLFHFLKLRLHPHAQFEIRVYAEAMLELIEPVVPVAVASFKKHQLGQP